jgi:hypothetical protein
VDVAGGVDDEATVVGALVATGDVVEDPPGEEVVEVDPATGLAASEPVEEAVPFDPVEHALRASSNAMKAMEVTPRQKDEGGLPPILDIRRGKFRIMTLTSWLRRDRARDSMVMGSRGRVERR